jgi:hypothetical protein
LKVSVVTPSFNSARYIRETIQSVIAQSGEFSIEYIVVDNCSTDGTKEIVEEFQRLLRDGCIPIGCNGVDLTFVSEKDNGMYDAINKGFEEATGEIFSWLNADDIYLPGALATITKAFTVYEDIHWIKGITSYITQENSIWRTGSCLVYAQEWIKAGIYGREHYYIQQDSVFWRAWLWKKCGGIDANIKQAGDYYLWAKFAQLAPLITVRSCISCFRSVEGQLSQDSASYMREVTSFSLGKPRLRNRVRLFLRFEERLPSFLKPFLFRLTFGRPEYSVILISADGKLKKISGEYYEVLSSL